MKKPVEYCSLVNFVNPGMLGTAGEFKRKYESVILRGRDADATQLQREKGDEALAEMASVVNKCIIRRTSALLTKYLPVCTFILLSESCLRSPSSHQPYNVFCTFLIISHLAHYYIFYKIFFTHRLNMN